MDSTWSFVLHMGGMYGPPRLARSSADPYLRASPIVLVAGFPFGNVSLVCSRGWFVVFFNVYFCFVPIFLITTDPHFIPFIPNCMSLNHTRQHKNPLLFEGFCG